MILNNTKSSRERFQVIPGSMGCHGDAVYSPQHKFQVVCGVDRGNGYQGYFSIQAVLDECKWMPNEVKQNLISFLKDEGYEFWLMLHGYIQPSERPDEQVKVKIGANVA